jgi:hypothetical protein
MYERVMLVRPLHLDFADDVMHVGSEATVVDLVDDGIVLLEFDLDSPEFDGGVEFKSALATVHDFVTVQA